MTYAGDTFTPNNVVGVDFGQKDSRKKAKPRCSSDSSAAAANEANGGEVAAGRKPDQDFNSLYVAYYAPLFNHVRRMVRSSEDAADIVHDLFVDFIAKKRLEGIDDPQRYIYRAARNAAFDHFKSAHVKRSSALGEQGELALSIIDEQAVSAEEQIIGREEIARVNEAMKKLTSKEQKVIREFYVEGRGWEVIAKDLGVTIRTAKNVRFKALRMIKEELIRKGAAR